MAFGGDNGNNGNENTINTLLTTENKPKLYQNSNINLSVSFRDLGKLAILRFGSITDFGKRLGVSRSRASQILNGLDCPKSPEQIKRIAEILDVDIVILTQLFSSVEWGKK